MVFKGVLRLNFIYSRKAKKYDEICNSFPLNQGLPALGNAHILGLHILFRAATTYFWHNLQSFPGRLLQNSIIFDLF